MKHHVFCSYKDHGELKAQDRGNGSSKPVLHVFRQKSEGEAELSQPKGFGSIRLHLLSDNLEEAAAEIEELAGEYGGSGEKVYLVLNEAPDILQLVFMQVLLENSDRHVYFIKKNKIIPAFKKNEDKEQNIYDSIHNLICARNYKSARKLAQRYTDSAPLSDMLMFGERLKSLDLSGGKGQEDYFDLMARTLRDMGEDKELADYAAGMIKLRERDQKAFISYLYNSAERLYEENKLIDFVVLYYRLAEELLLYALGLDIDWDRGGNGFKNRDNAYFKVELRKKERVTRHFHSYMRLLDRRAEELEKKEEINQVDEFFIELHRLFSDSELNDILELRHAGVSGHGFCDFSKEQFSSICRMDPLKKIEPIMDFVSINREIGIFELVEKCALYLARQGLEEGQAGKKGA
ncbi:hypothetical protein [Peribacillus sp. SCS-37]|uniref:hypothetical protein n=1 Tax=Paraperibacillus esterisolvens TaxID=3115296 RepID=UPI0039059C45